MRLFLPNREDNGDRIYCSIEFPVSLKEPTAIKDSFHCLFPILFIGHVSITADYRGI